MPEQPQPQPLKPLEPPMVPVMLIGTGAWAAIGLGLLAAGAPDGWLRTCLAGFLVGLALTALMVVRHLYRRRRHGRGGTSSTSESS